MNRSSASPGSLLAALSTPSRPPQNTYVGAPSSAATSMLRMVFWIATRRTARSFDVKAPSLNIGCQNRLVVAIEQTMPVSSRPFLNRSSSARRWDSGAPKDMRSSSWKLTPQAPISARPRMKSTGSIGGRVASPNGSRPRLPIVHRPKANLCSGFGVRLSDTGASPRLVKRGDRCGARQGIKQECCVTQHMQMAT